VSASPLVVLPVADLEALIERAVRRALEAQAANAAPEPEWLDTKGVAALLGVHPRSVPQYVRRDGLPCKRLGPKTVRYERAAVLAWIASRRR
jgi:hypothetical protein